MKSQIPSVTYFRDRSTPPVSKSPILKITQNFNCTYKVLSTTHVPMVHFFCVSPRLAGTIDINEGDPFVRSKALCENVRMEQQWTVGQDQTRWRLEGGVNDQMGRREDFDCVMYF